MDETSNYATCPLCSRKLEYYVEFSNVLCVACHYHEPYDEDDEDDDHQHSHPHPWGLTDDD